jgi:hypothetical protein
MDTPDQTPERTIRSGCGMSTGCCGVLASLSAERTCGTVLQASGASMLSLNQAPRAGSELGRRRQAHREQSPLKIDEQALLCVSGECGERQTVLNYSNSSPPVQELAYGVPYIPHTPTAAARRKMDQCRILRGLIRGWANRCPVVPHSAQFQETKRFFFSRVSLVFLFLRYFLGLARNPKNLRRRPLWLSDFR